MEPDVIRLYSSSPPPMEDGAEEEDDEFGDFGTFSAVPNSISFTELDTPTTFNQMQALNATSPPEILGSRAVRGLGSSNGTCGSANDCSKVNGIMSASHLSHAPSDRTEIKKAFSCSPSLSAGETTGGELADCNGQSTEALTNGFDVQENPASPSSLRSYVKGTSTPADDFADFVTFSYGEGPLQQKDDLSDPAGGGGEASSHDQQGACSGDMVTITNTTGPDMSGSGSPSAPCEDPVWDVHTDSHQRGGDLRAKVSDSEFYTNKAAALNGVEPAEDKEPKDGEGCDANELSPDTAAESEVEQSDDKGSENETETETSFGRLLSTDALEEFGDISTTGSVPSPPLQGEPSTPAEHSQLGEDEEDFGDFGDTCSFTGQGFADFDQLDIQEEDTPPQVAENDDFGDFNSPKPSETKQREGGAFSNFHVSPSFGNFNLATTGKDDGGGWGKFGQQAGEDTGESWAAFDVEQIVAPPTAGGGNKDVEKEEEEQWHKSEADNTKGTNTQAVLSTRLLQLFESSFPQSTSAVLLDSPMTSLRVLLERPEDQEPEAKGEEDEEEGTRSTSDRWTRGSVWMRLRDVNEALGLRYQWGGSHCNKVLLCCLGIDTRNILFTGQKKQPVIVPMYAASLGMLEPTKEPVKPVSAAEMIASIAQTSLLAPEKSSCSSDSVQQELLPPVQFDWSSSGLTNPLDASGGSSLLNLDFFGPVEDSGSNSSTSIPGVDPELFELTTAKMDAGANGSRVADAFARLMSTMEKTSTSTRKPMREENLSAEAVKVMGELPDLSFMQAKVLMFPTTLTPLYSHTASD